MKPQHRWARLSLSLRRKVMSAERKNPTGIEWIADLVDMGPAPRTDRQFANAIRIRLAMLAKHDGEVKP